MVVDKLDYNLIIPKNDSLPYIVLIHGAGGDKSQWEFQIDFLSKKEFGILAISLPNHGESSSDPDTVLYEDSVSKSLITEYTNDIIDLISSLGLMNYCLVGHSMGGAIVLNFVLLLDKGIIEDPPRPPKVIFLIGTGAKLNVAPVFFDLLKTDFKEGLRLMSKFSYGTNADLSIKQKNQNILTNNGSHVLYNDLEACRHFDVRKDLGRIKILTIILCGDQDQMTPPKFSQYLHENIKHSQIFFIKDSGHFVFQEAPIRVNDIIHKSVISGMANNDR
jgi:pimeloyl-ACP methyl ester carboxylesterase